MKIIYMNETLVNISNKFGEKELNKLINNGEIIRKEELKPYLLIEENDTKEEKAKQK